MPRQPLDGLNILITRPRDQAASLAQGVEQAGGKALLFPLLDIVPVPDAAELNNQLAHLDQYQLAIFISPNAVQYGMTALKAAGPLPPQLRIAAVGQGSARALHAMGIPAVIAPRDRFDSEALLALPELQEVTGWKVIIFRGNGGRELLGDTLKARGATVGYATCYHRLKPAVDLNALLAAQPDALTLTSSEALLHLWDAAPVALRPRLTALPLFAPHERIAALARSLGWQQAIATPGGDAGLLAGLREWAENRPR